MIKEQVQKWLDSNYKNYLKKNSPLDQSVLDHIMDWMNSSDAESYLNRLDRVAVPAAIGLANKWTEKLNKDAEKLLKQQNDPDLKNIETIYKFNNGYSVVRLMKPNAFHREGLLMGHCVGSYADYIDQNATAIYSLRDSKNEPHCTIEFDIKQRHIKQVKGKCNEAVVPKYHNYVIEFLNQFNFDTIYSHDIKNINAIYFGNYFFKTDEMPLVYEINKDLKIELSNYKHTFKSLTVNGDMLLSKNRRTTKIADTLIVKGDLVIEEYHGLLKIADTLVVTGAIEIDNCENLRLLANKVEAQSVDIFDCERFNDESLALKAA